MLDAARRLIHNMLADRHYASAFHAAIDDAAADAMLSPLRFFFVAVTMLARRRLPCVAAAATLHAALFAMLPPLPPLRC